MKQQIIILLAVFISVSAFAQSPEKMSYQAILRNANNELVKNQQVGLRISILQGSVNGTAVYVETQAEKTNENGLISIEIGTGVTGDRFSEINWADGPYYIKTETALDGGTKYDITGTSQLLSVPYALHAKTAERIVGAIDHQGITYFPQSSGRSTSVLVSFSGNTSTNFSKSLPVVLAFEQATPIFPSQVRYVNNQKVDVKFYIPWNAATGTYDIILNPNNVEPTILEKAFLIDWF